MWFLSACCLFGDPDIESFAGTVPVTLEGVRDLADPPATTVAEVRVVESPTGLGACGHSPVCLIVLPVMLVEALFPEKYDQITVTTEGAVVWSGTFTTDGDFIQARVREGDELRDLRRLDLEAIGRRMVVEVARGPVGGEPAPTPILPQVDLLELYDLNLRHSDDPDRRGRLVAEAYRWLGDESVPWVLEHVRDPVEHDGTKAAAVAGACSAVEAPGRAEIVQAASTSPGARTGAAALACFSPGEAGVDVFLAALAADLCAAESCDALEPLTGWEEPDRVRLTAARAHATCTIAAGRVVLGRTAGIPRTRLDVRQALQDGRAECLPGLLDADDVEERAGMVARLDDEAELGGAIFEKLDDSARPLEAAELEGVAQAYLRESLLEATTDKRRSGLRLFRRGPGAAALEVLRAAEPSPMADIGRVVLGDAERALPAAKALRFVTVEADLPSLSGDAELVAEGLEMAGCDPAGIVATAKAAREGGLGRGCVR